MSNRDGRRIRRLQHILFAYKSADPSNSTQSYTTPDPGCNTTCIVDVVGFAHGGESFLDTTMYSWIPNPRVIDRQWTPAHIQSGTGGNPRFLLGMRTRSPRPRGLVVETVEWQPVSTEPKGRAQKTAAPCVRGLCCDRLSDSSLGKEVSQNQLCLAGAWVRMRLQHGKHRSQHC